MIYLSIHAICGLIACGLLEVRIGRIDFVKGLVMGIGYVVVGPVALGNELAYLRR